MYLRLALFSLSSVLMCTTACAQRVPGDVRIDDTAVFPESITSTSDGTIP